MDMTPTTTTATPKSPEPESETPTRIQPAKPISFSNGIIKRHHHLHHHHHHNHAVVPVVYKECLKNHAATLGGHALDGCGEFMPSPTSNPSDPTSLKCAACGCHRNFHRREPDDSSAPVAALQAAHPSSAAAIEYQPHHRHHPPPPVGHPPPPPPGQSRSPNSASPPPISSSYMLLALSGTNNNAGNALAFSDLNFGGNHLSTHQAPGSRKRFRTKFSQFQKEKMHEFAERVGWKMQKRDEEEIRDFCREIGVDKGVLKVWMHNNKNTLNRRDPFSGIVSGVRRSDNGEGIHTAVAATGDSNNNNGDRSGEGGVRSIGHDLHHHHGGGFESDSGGANGGNANGSSSSS